MAGHDIIVIGASAGGVEALLTIVRDMPRDLPAAVFMVLHIPAQAPSRLPEILSRRGALPVTPGIDGAPIEYGHIYIAPADHHLLVHAGHMRAVRGPRENRHRPAVDPLFRSAARTYGPRVIGVVLTGALDDGTAGLQAIKTRGGMAVVQDPADSLFPSMPQSAIEHVPVDYVLPLADIAATLVRLAHEPAPEEVRFPVPDNMNTEANIAAMDPAALHESVRLGPPSNYSCPECGGVLHEIQDKEILRFRCRVGHAFSSESVLAEQSQVLETALWTALNTLEESASLSRRMLRQAQANGRDWLARRFEAKVREAEQRAEVIRQVLLRDEITPETIEPSATAAPPPDVPARSNETDLL